jgi:hypothetical protein
LISLPGTFHKTGNLGGAATPPQGASLQEAAELAPIAEGTARKRLVRMMAKNGDESSG